MPGDARIDLRAGHEMPRWLIYIVVLGLYLTLRGYHSFDGDQTYRLPLLLHQQDRSTFASDPFVRSFDVFNPHRGSVWVLDLVTRPLGLAAGLFLVFVITFSMTCLGVDRLARAVWPELGSHVGLVAVGLLLAAKAGNIGTNHLFEAMVLDRLMALALGWLALADAVKLPSQGPWRGMAAIAVATLIHPSVGLQLALVLAASWMLWGLLGRRTEVSAGVAVRGIVGMIVAVLPGLAVNLGPGSSLQGNMPSDVFWLLSVELQSPQHMLPHLWRMPQWLAWGCYLALSALAMTGWRPSRESESGEIKLSSRWPAARFRLVAVVGVILVGLGAAWYAIEVLHHVRLTIFQPFRMATVVRGIALVFVAGRLVALWRSGGWMGRLRAVVIAAAFTGDWLLVMVTRAELAVFAVEIVRARLPGLVRWRFVDSLVFLATLAFGLNFLAHHDTEYGNRTLVAALVVGVAAARLSCTSARLDAIRDRLFGRIHINHLRAVAVLAVAWLLPLVALLAAAVPLDHVASDNPLVRSLINRCRFAAVPADDIERLGLWCREHTPASARLIGPPGPKTLRLWSRRSVAFNRAASPYHAAGLADWFARFQDHVDFHGTPAEFVHSYVGDRHGFEARYQAQTDAERAALALRQGASYVIAAAPGDRKQDRSSQPAIGPLELLHVEGRYAVYRVNQELLVQRQR
jgi:hypothetical protein